MHGQLDTRPPRGLPQQSSNKDQMNGYLLEPCARNCAACLPGGTNGTGK